MKKEEKVKNSEEIKIDNALGKIFAYGGIDGSHHKDWLIDQVVRILTGGNYESWVSKFKHGEDGPDSYDWDEGIAP